MATQRDRLIAVIGATGRQGGGVVRAIAQRGRFRVRALTRDPATHRALADEVVEADLNRPETLSAALRGVHGVFAMTNFWEPGGIDELAQGRAAVCAASDAGVKHFVWSTLPDVEAISGGKYHVPHFTDKAHVDSAVRGAGFEYHTYVIPPFFYQNLLRELAPQRGADGSIAWTLPVDPHARILHMGDISELGRIVAGAFEHPEEVGGGQYLPLVGDFLSYDDIVATLNAQGHTVSFQRVPREVYASFFPGAGELAEMFGYFEDYTYLGRPMAGEIALANRIAGVKPTDFATWARANMRAGSKAGAS